jgi:YVTN family beta-propeller protein
MKLTKKTSLSLTAVLISSLTFTGCDDPLLRTQPLFTRPDDPPDLVTIGQVNGRTSPVVIHFQRYGTGASVVVSPSSPLPQSTSKTDDRRFDQSSGSGSGSGGAQDPDPDPFDFPEPPPDPRTPNDDPWEEPPPPPDLPPDDSDPNGPSKQTTIEISININGTVYTITITVGPGAGVKTGVRLAQSEKAAATYRVGSNPAGMTITPDGKFLLVANTGSASISVIDRTQQAVVRTLQLPSSVKPYGIAVSNDGTRAYVTNFQRIGAQLLVVDMATGNVLATSTVAPFPAGVRVTPDGTQVYVTSNFEGSVAVFDTLTNTQVGLLRGFDAAWGIAFNPSGTRAYVACAGVPTGSVKVIDTAKLQIIASVNTGNNTRKVLVSPTGRHVFALNRDSGTITQIETATNTAVRTINVGTKVWGLGFAY